MKRIMIIGNGGAGKTTLSIKMGVVLSYDVIHLDQYYWKPNWTERDSKEWKGIVEILSSGDTWIIDGNYNGTMDIRLERADTIIYLDYPAWMCFYRVLKRVFKYKGKTRPDMGKNCPERLDWIFLHYVATFNIKRKGNLLKKINTYSTKGKKVHIFRKPSRTEAFLKRLSITHSTQKN